MKSPVKTTITVRKNDMSMFWGDDYCGPSDIIIRREETNIELSPDTEDYQAYVTFTFDKDGDLYSVRIDLAGPVIEPTIDPNEPIPYEVTEKGKEWLEGHPENEREEARIRQVFGLK